MAAVIPGRRGARKAPSIPAGLNAEQRAFFEQVQALLKRNIYHVDGWFQNAVAANQAAVILNLYQGNAPQVWVAPRDGWIIDIWVSVDAARTAGQLNIYPYKNGTLFGTITAQIDAVNTTYKLTQTPATKALPVNAGDQISLRITTTAAWAPVTANLRAGMEVQL